MSNEQETKNVVPKENNVAKKTAPVEKKEGKLFSEEEMMQIVGKIKEELNSDLEKRESERESVYKEKMNALAESLANKIDPTEAEKNLKKLVPTVTAYKINDDYVTSITMAVDSRTVNEKNIVVFDQQYLIKLINPKTRDVSERIIKIED